MLKTTYSIKRKTKRPMIMKQPDLENPCIFVVHASVGSGHRSAAKSIAQALEELRENPPECLRGLPDNYDIEVIDILDYSRVEFDGDKTASMFTGVTRPVYDISWRFNFTGRLLWGGGWGISIVMFPEFTELIKKRKPMAVIATHIMGANCAAGARMRAKQNFPIISVPTDYETEGLWPHQQTDLFCVGTEYMVETLRPRGVPDTKIMLTGIPTRKGFRQDHDKEACRKKFGLPEDKKVIIALAGAKLPTPYIHLRRRIYELLPYMHAFSSMHLIIVAGADKEYAQDLRSEIANLALKNVEVYEYVEDIASLMAASDLAICKAGGLTTTECLCSRCPMILVGQAYGQERANVIMLTDTGAAKHVTTTYELMHVLHDFTQNPEAMDALLINADMVRRPMASVDIAKASLELALSELQMPSTRYSYCMNLYAGDKPAHTR